jgi:protoporphyrin/coproporphyrin ferrochelatase
MNPNMSSAPTDSDFAVLLVNLGSPDSTSVPDVRRYLHQFLMDPYVLDVPWPLRKMIVCFGILPRRPARTAEAYAAIWSPDGSPLVATTRAVTMALDAQAPYPVAMAMRYGHPSIAEGIEALHRRCAGRLRRLLLVPLYPQYAMSTTRTVVDAARRALRRRPEIALDVLPPFHARTEYLDAMTAIVAPRLAPGHDHVLFSYHGLPERHLRKTDPSGRHCLASPDCCTARDAPAHATCYRAQALRTTADIAARAGLHPDRYSVAFQSRLGRDPWLTPFADAEIARLARAGCRRLAVLCPSFVTDCLETLEEMGLRGRELFVESGGESFDLIPCLNDHPAWLGALRRWCDNAYTAHNH